MKYKCGVCGFIYLSEDGDPDNRIAPGTDLEDLPMDWECPVCGADKEQFRKV
ncbi:MAG: rubredoxin [Bacillota bacterium]|nr:rubredoxin [Bacillota bacterium]